MKFLLSILASAALVATSVGQDGTKREVCYDKYGCFSTDSPWTSLIRPLSALPNPPYEVGTRFILFCRDAPEYMEMGYELMVDKDPILEFSPFNPARRTVFLIHGFTDSHKAKYVWNAMEALLANEDINVIAIDWRAGAKAPYLGATANARLVGAMTARMIAYLEEKGGLNVEDVHIIGHNLGAHVAGYAGDRLGGRLPRITAVDPSDPYFGGTDPIVRLDTGDARFVEVIHTNGNGALNLGMGIVDPIGHVDIFPNGGRSQPGCADLLGNLIISIIDLITLNFEGAISTWACSHLRGADFYVESIKSASSCGFTAVSCADYSTFQKGSCFTTCKDAGKCYNMGYNAKPEGASGVYYLHTGDGKDNSSYCLQTVQIQAPINPSQAGGQGTLTIKFKGDDGKLSGAYTVMDDVKFSGGQILSVWAEVPSSILSDPDKKQSLILNYKRGGLLPGNQPSTLALDHVNLLIVDPALQMHTVQYEPVTLTFNTDTQISQ